MSANIFWMLTTKIKEGELSNLRQLITEMSDSTKLNEPDALNYEWFISSDEKFCHLFERYSDSNSTIVHINNFVKNYAARFMAILEIKNFTVYGEPSDELLKLLTPMGAVYMKPAGGFLK